MEIEEDDPPTSFILFDLLPGECQTSISFNYNIKPINVGTAEKIHSSLNNVSFKQKKPHYSDRFYLEYLLIFQMLCHVALFFYWHNSTVWEVSHFLHSLILVNLAFSSTLLYWLIIHTFSEK